MFRFRVIVSCFFGRPLSIVKRRQPFRIAVEQLGVLVGTEVPASAELFSDQDAELSDGGVRRLTSRQLTIDG